MLLSGPRYPMMNGVIFILNGKKLFPTQFIFKPKKTKHIGTHPLIALVSKENKKRNPLSHFFS